jgi:hypothetical protein
MRQGRLISAALACMAMIAVLLVATPASAADPLPPDCSSGYQIGSTATVKWQGATIASVKQYYSSQCRKNWAYLYIWESFRNQGYGWGTSAWISDRSGRVYGEQWVRNNINSFSARVSTVNLCTHAAAEVWVYESRSPLALPIGVGSASTDFRPAGC